MPNDESNTTPSHENGSEMPRKAPIDQWIDGDITSTSILDRLLSSIGISPKK